LKDYLKQAGEVTYADAHKDRPNEGCVCRIMLWMIPILALLHAES